MQTETMSKLFLELSQFLPDTKTAREIALEKRLAAAEADAERWMDVSVDGYPAEPCVVLIARDGKTVMGAFIAGRFWYRNEHVAVLFWRHLPKPPDPTDVHIDAARGGGAAI